MEQLLKTKEVSDQLGVNPTTIQRWIKFFNIPCQTNDLGHYIIPISQLNTFMMIKEKLNSGKVMKEILMEMEKNNRGGYEKVEKVTANEVVNKLDRVMLQIVQLERKVDVKADEVVEYQVLQHRSELDSLLSIIEKIDERMSNLEQKLAHIEPKVVGEDVHIFPMQIQKQKKNRLRSIFSL